MTNQPRSANKILTAPHKEFERLRPKLREVSCQLGETIYLPEQKMEYVYFINQGIVSWLATLENGWREEVMSEKRVHTVLVVEDVDEISSNMTSALRERGHQVEHASNAEQAIKMAERNRPAMILTDLDLPTFDKLLDLLRGHAGLNNMVVAVMDINHPPADERCVNILSDFQALDDLLQSSQKSQPL